MSQFLDELKSSTEIFVKQKKEFMELLGFETRNKYEIYNSSRSVIGFAAEQGKGIWSFIGRSFLGHWRVFRIAVFDAARNQVLELKHPFRWYFQCLEIYNASGVYLGKLEKRFAILTKSFDIHDASGKVVFEIRSPFWKFWTFPILRGTSEEAVVSKRWSGALKEMLLDADNFGVKFTSQRLTDAEKTLIFASALYIDLEFFEKKGNNN